LNLQGGSARDEWRQLAGRGALRDTQLCNSGILPLASVIAQLDLVISVDTLAAHLAGALGVPAWVMLQHEADWRWMVNRRDSPWYPSLRLFRQPSPGAWHAVIESVEAALRHWLGIASERLVA
jgi:ADP-heptose:LPS heptosyltransferase